MLYVKSFHDETFLDNYQKPNQQNFYRPQTKLRKGNVFTSVCQEFCPQGEVYTPQADTPFPLGRHPSLADTPFTLGRHPPIIRWPLQRTVRILLECILVSAADLKANLITKYYVIEYTPL